MFYVQQQNIFFFNDVTTQVLDQSLSTALPAKMPEYLELLYNLLNSVEIELHELACWTTVETTPDNRYTLSCLVPAVEMAHRLQSCSSCLT